MKMKKIGPGGESKFYYVDPPLHLHELTYMSVMVKQTVMGEDNAVSTYHLKISGIYLISVLDFDTFEYLTILINNAIKRCFVLITCY